MSLLLGWTPRELLKWGLGAGLGLPFVLSKRKSRKRVRHATFDRGHQHASCCMIRAMRDIAASGQNHHNRNVLVEVIPVQSDAADLNLIALLRVAIKSRGNC
jgi:hypothetical protein